MDDALERIDQTRALVDQRTGRPRGLGDFEREDVTIPRLAIGQPTSKRVQDGEMKFGDLYNTVTGQVYRDTNGKPFIEFIVVQFRKQRILWESDNKGIAHMSNDGKVANDGKICATECPFNAYEWSEGPKGERISPKCTQFFNYISVLAPFQSTFPIAISMGRTNAKAAKKLNSFIMNTQQDIFAWVYSASTEIKENQKGRFGVFVIKPVGIVPPATYKAMEELYNQFSGAEVVVHQDGMAEDDKSGDEPPF
jgi:hypothetical protein